MKGYLLCILSSFLIHHSFSQEYIDVTEQTLKLGRMQEEVLYFGFAEGDQIILNFLEVNNKELKELEIIEYPSNSKFSDFKISKLENKVLNVLKTGIYKFRFQNTALVGRVCKIKIQRIPASDSTKLFNTNVVWVEKQDTTWNTYTKDVVVGYDTTYEQKTKKELVKIEQSEELIFDKMQRVHSTTNENGNKASVIFTLPQNKVNGNKVTSVASWAYWIGVGEESNQAWQQNVKAIKTLTNSTATYFTSPLGALAIGAVSDLMIPKIGEDVSYCVLDIANRNLFHAGQPYKGFDFGKGVAGFRKFIGHLTQGAYSICLENDNYVQGINVSVKVIAILETKYFEDSQYTEQIIVPRYEKKIFKDPIIVKAKVPTSVI